MGRCKKRREDGGRRKDGQIEPSACKEDDPSHPTSGQVDGPPKSMIWQ